MAHISDLVVGYPKYISGAKNYFVLEFVSFLYLPIEKPKSPIIYNGQLYSLKLSTNILSTLIFLCIIPF